MAGGGSAARAAAGRRKIRVLIEGMHRYRLTIVVSVVAMGVAGEMVVVGMMMVWVMMMML